MSHEEKSKMEKCFHCNSWGRVEDMILIPVATKMQGHLKIFMLDAFACEDCSEELRDEIDEKLQESLLKLKSFFGLMNGLEAEMRGSNEAHKQN